MPIRPIESLEIVKNSIIIFDYYGVNTQFSDGKNFYIFLHNKDKQVLFNHQYNQFEIIEKNGFDLFVHIDGISKEPRLIIRSIFTKDDKGFFDIIDLDKDNSWMQLDLLEEQDCKSSLAKISERILMYQDFQFFLTEQKPSKKKIKKI